MKSFQQEHHEKEVRFDVGLWVYPVTTDLENHVSSLLQQIGHTKDFALEPLPGGGNNKVFRVFTAESNFLLKSYFFHSDDPRDRLLHEFSFCSYANQFGITSLPRAVIQDRERRLGLYEFIQGRRLTREDVNIHSISAAERFFLDLNKHRISREAKELPVASEAYFSIEEHLQAVGKRVDRLKYISTDLDIDRCAKKFVEECLIPKWKQTVLDLQSHAFKLGINTLEVLPFEERCLSPSDFGFHNALCRNNGEICFLDFEYAGWDEAAKMVGDFFCQVAFPIPRKFRNNFAESIIGSLPHPDKHRARIELLFPIFQMKWCCIILNNFLDVGNRRRLFADETLNSEERKRMQLEKAERYLQNFEEERGFFHS